MRSRRQGLFLWVAFVFFVGGAPCACTDATGVARARAGELCAVVAGPAEDLVEMRRHAGGALDTAVRELDLAARVARGEGVTREEALWLEHGGGREGALRRAWQAGSEAMAWCSAQGVLRRRLLSTALGATRLSGLPAPSMYADRAFACARLQEVGNRDYRAEAVVPFKEWSETAAAREAAFVDSCGGLPRR